MTLSYSRAGHLAYWVPVVVLQHPSLYTASYKTLQTYPGTREIDSLRGCACKELCNNDNSKITFKCSSSSDMLYKSGQALLF
jgi:hypothetical protein